MKIVRLVIDKKGVLSLEKIHRQFFFLAGHMFNELVVLRRLLLYSEKPEEPSILRDARSTWGLIILRLLAGKLWESWSAIKKYYHQPEVANSPWLKDNETIAEPLGQIKRYFSHQNVVSTIRNNFGFHYSLPEVDLSNYGPDDNIDFLMGDSLGNTIYYSSEVMVTSDIFDLFPDLEPEESFDRIVNEIASQSRLMLAFLNDYIGATCKYLAENCGGVGQTPEEVNILQPKSLEEAKIEIVIEDV
jgi:hypothetical protein